MSSFSSTSILAAVALFSLITVSLPDGTTAIKCYQCTSKADSVCGQDNLPKNPEPSHPASKFLIDCSTLDGSRDHRDSTVPSSEKYTFCRKQVQDVEGNINIVRGCGLVKGDKPCYSTANPPTKTEVCQCFEDGCNGATATMSSLVMTIISALVFFVAFNNNRGN